MLVDRWGRAVTYLRISVTDRCNLRCVYCMPAEGVVRRTHDEILRYEEIVEVVRVAAEQGIQRVRITGGEPLVRLGLTGFVRQIAAVPGIDDISLTTNGLLLEKMAEALKEAGLRRINVSLDSLRPDVFSRITRGGSLETVMRGLEAADRAGLAPIKINVVAMRGVNDSELVDLARLSLERSWHVRFIELMPVSNQQPWGSGFPAPDKAYLSIREIKAALAPLGLKPVKEMTIGLPAGSDPAGHLLGCAGSGPAQEYFLTGGKGRVGFISPLSEHFCQTCNRLRLTADGSFRSCLLQDVEIPFLEAMRAGEPVLPYLLRAVESKPAGHDMAPGSASRQPPSSRCMLQIGG